MIPETSEQGCRLVHSSCCLVVERRTTHEFLLRRGQRTGIGRLGFQRRHDQVAAILPAVHFYQHAHGVGERARLQVRPSRCVDLPVTFELFGSIEGCFTFRQIDRDRPGDCGMRSELVGQIGYQLAQPVRLIGDSERLLERDEAIAYVMVEAHVEAL